MQENKEEEDELALLDYRTPKGQLIKLAEQKIKKPVIDDSLGKILDQFSQLTNEQSTFLENGIFHMNFAEDALLLQSCGLLYAKRVDVLWDELLQFHTRMVKYDETTAKHCTDSNTRDARKQELARLEERINRGKRKKIVLTEPESETSAAIGCYVFDIDQDDYSELFSNISFPLPEEGEVEVDEPPVEPFEPDLDVLEEWRIIQSLDEDEKAKSGGSVLVAQYQRLRYRLKPYSTSSSEEMIYDFTDPDEFNTREGRLISYHHIKHLFEYNDLCLLPDEDFTVTQLRIAYVLKKKWFQKNKVDPNAPYETYKEAWEKYEKELCENEKRKIQNMPQSTPEELMRFYKALARKEQIAIEKVKQMRASGATKVPVISFETVIVAPAKEGYEGIFDPYIPEDFDTPPPVVDLAENPPAPPLDAEHEAELSSLLGDVTKLQDPSAAIVDKPRSDSGYFDGAFEADDDSDHEEQQPERAATGGDTPFEFDKENTENKETDPTSNPSAEITQGGEAVPNSTEAIEEPDTNNNNSKNASLIHISGTEQSSEQAETAVMHSSGGDAAADSDECEEVASLCENKDEMNKALKEFIKNATTERDLLYKALENSYFNQTEDLITIIYDKEAESESDGDSVCGDQIVVYGRFPKSKEFLTTKASADKSVDKRREDKMEENRKRKRDEPSKDENQPKRRRLSQKQVALLKKSLIEPVKEQKWESFFSLNYQPETGEGEIPRVDYESDREDEDLCEDEDEDADHMNVGGDVSGYHSDHEDANVNHPMDVDDDDNDKECQEEPDQMPLTQDSGVNLDTSLDNAEETTQTENEPVQPQPEKPSEPQNSENVATSLENADFSKTTNISPEELEQEQRQTETPKLTPYEQERENVRERVVEWKEYIMPKLKKLDEQDFDIHEYGTNIMNNLNFDEPKPFSELVGGKTSAEVVRYFISSLQLANTLNVEICGAKKGELSNDTFELKLLSKERYHEHFQEYQAPSEETLGERLQKVKEIRMMNKSQKKQSSKRKSANDQEYQPRSILKTPKSSSKHSNSDSLSSSKKIRIVSYNVATSANQKSGEDPPGTASDRRHDDFQRPSTSWQADLLDQQSAVESAISEIEEAPARISVDSGVMPSCDEDFLEQFDQLQQISDSHLQSTPNKPRKTTFSAR